jgi:uncharacterized protein with PQ loop repeat
MAPDPMTTTGHESLSDSLLRRIMGGMSVFTMLMTIPQVYTVWVEREVAGVSVLSWSAYFLSAVMWLVYGLRQGDKNITWPCYGWIVLDLAVIAGVLTWR